VQESNNTSYEIIARITEVGDYSEMWAEFKSIYYRSYSIDPDDTRNDGEKYDVG